MTWARIGALLCAALVACSAGAGYASSTTPGRWVLTDVGKLAALAFPEYEYTAFLGTTSDGRIYWLSGPKDGRGIRELFEWQKGTISDLGTVPLVLGVVNDEGAVAGSDFSAPFGPGS